MSSVGYSVVSALFGTKEQIGVNRGIAEFHARRPVRIAGGGETLLALPVEGLDAQRLAEFMTLCAPVVPRLVITARRALALDLDATAPVALCLNGGVGVDEILALVADAKMERPVDVMSAGPAAMAAIQLAKLSQGLPAVLVADVTAGAVIATEPHIITVEADAVATLRRRSHPVPGDRQQSARATRFRQARMVRRLPRRDGRQSGRDHRRQAGFFQTRSRTPALGLPHRRCIRLATMRLRRSTETCDQAP